MEEAACCVVGGGPAGMMLGLLLARAGIEVTVLEKHGDFLRDFRGDTVHPSTLRLLDELGLGRRFAELPARRLTEMRMEIDGSVVVMADFGRLRGPHRYIAMVPQWDFLDLLAGAAAEEPAFTLRMRHTVTGLLRDAHGRVRGVRGTGPEGEFELAARLVVACDGRDSAVREAAGLRQRMCEVPMDVWQVRVPMPAEAGPGDVKDGRVFARFGGGQAAVTMDRGDYFQTSYLIPKGADAELRAHDIGWLRGRLGELFGWDEQVTAAIRGWEDVELLEVTMGRLPRWYADGLLCIGDAAHTMSPVGGMGVNLAVQDAVAAARRLAGPLAAGTAGAAGAAGAAVSARVLRAVQRRRTPPTVFAQRAQLAEHETLLRPALAGTLRGDRLPQPLRAVRAIPALGGVTAYMGGVGLRPERAPAWARR